jgi:hypothetical protein
MKTLILIATGSFLSLTAAIAADQTTKTTVTTEGGVTTRQTTTTTSSGTLTEYAPGTTFIVKESTGPVTYNYGKTVVYATRSGRILTDEDIKARIRVGLPVNISYANEGTVRVINRVVIDD